MSPTVVSRILYLLLFVCSGILETVLPSCIWIRFSTSVWYSPLYQCFTPNKKLSRRRVKNYIKGQYSLLLQYEILEKLATLRRGMLGPGKGTNGYAPFHNVPSTLTVLVEGSLLRRSRVRCSKLGTINFFFQILDFKIYYFNAC